MSGLIHLAMAKEVNLRHLLNLLFLLSPGPLCLDKAFRDVLSQSNDVVTATPNLVHSLLPKLVHF